LRNTKLVFVNITTTYCTLEKRYLVVPEETWLDVLAVNLAVDVPDLEVAELPQHSLHPRHDMVDEAAYFKNVKVAFRFYKRYYCMPIFMI